MVHLVVKYYFQDSQEIEEDFHTFRGRLNMGLSENWGFVVRVDYMEHQTSEDRSILAGPTYTF